MRADKRPNDRASIKIAVPLFGERVSPYFGVSSKILLVETVGEKIASKTTWEMTEQSAVEISRRLVAFGVNILICGGIQNIHKQSLTHHGVWVVDNQKGNAEELLAQMIRQPDIRRKTNCDIRACRLKNRRSNENKRR